MIAVDQPVRDQALDTQQSFAVSAPAGSGKTGLLIRRILRLLANCEHPEQVLAITFTRKAAAEMHQRIVSALIRAEDTTPPESDYEQQIWQDAQQVLKRDKALDWQLIASPSRLRIMTIDSLCRHLARQLAIETGLGELPEPSEQPQVHYQEAIHTLFAELDSPGPVADSLALLLAHLDNNMASLEGLLETLVAQREQWLGPVLRSQDARDALESALRSAVTDSLQTTRSLLGTFASPIAELCDYAAANLIHLKIDQPLQSCLRMDDLPDTEPTAENLTQWQSVADLLLTKSGSWRAKADKRAGFPTKKESKFPELADQRKQQLKTLIEALKSEPALLQQFEELRNLPSIAYSDNQWQLLEALSLILPRLVAVLSVVFKERRSCDFTEITLAATAALGYEQNPTATALKLDYQIQHILVDEFQDTSSLQFDLIKKLLAGWQHDDGRTLFIVGDGMQSLYGFRSANVGLFLEARQMPINQVELTALDLSVNFRSDPGIVNWVNDTFKHVFPVQEDISRGAVPYAAASAAQIAAPQSQVTLDIFEPPANAVDEAHAIVKRIKAAQALDSKGTIAILARARSHLQPILAALYEANIVWQAEDIDPLASRMPVIDLLSLTRALLNPADRIAWLSILRAPWCGLNLNDLHHIANTIDDSQKLKSYQFPWLPQQIFSGAVAEGLSEDGHKILTRVASIFESAWQNRYRKPLRISIEGLWLALGGPATLLNSNELAWCQQFFDLLERHAQGATLTDINAFETAVNKLYAAPELSTDNPVQIMTIHKSKGLEFDTVIIPSLHRGGGKNDSTLLYWREHLNSYGESQLLLAPPLSPREQNNSKDSSQLVRHIKYEKKRKTHLEDARVLYVACTRAVQRLHLFFALPEKAPSSGSLLASLWPAFESGFEVGGASVNNHAANLEATDTNSSNEPLTTLLRLKSDWKNPSSVSTGSEPLSPTSQVAKIRDNDNFTARHTGTVLHRTLHQIVIDGVKRWNKTRIIRQTKVWEIQLKTLGVTEIKIATETLHKAVTTMLKDSTGQWLLDNTHPQSACELALNHLDDSGQPTLSVIDRLFIDKNTLWIIDYKSAQPSPEQSLQNFIKTEVSNYRQQLLRYQKIAKSMHKGEIKSALYFPLIAHLEVVC